MSEQPSTIILSPSWMIPVEPANVVLTEHSLVIEGPLIVDLLPTEQALQAYPDADHQKLDGQVLMPGLINAHTHSAMVLLRGLADDKPLMQWLNDTIWPAEQALVSEAFVADGTRLAILEMLRSGTTCFNEHYFFPDVIADTAIDMGMRASVGLVVIDVPTPWSDSAEACLKKDDACLASHADKSPLVTFCWAPHAPYTVSDMAFAELADRCTYQRRPLHIHLHESADEINMSLELYNKRPLERLASLGLVNDRLIAVHMTQVDENDTARMAESGAHVVTCPVSNLKLASGFCPVDDFHKAGVNVAIGTDGPASNNGLNLWSDMRTAALLAKAVANDPCAADAHTALRMVTLNAAKTLGLGQQIGSLEKGKQADFVTVDMGSIFTQPAHNPASHLVYAIQSEQITSTWVAGVCRYHHQRGFNVGGMCFEQGAELANKWAEKTQRFSIGA